MALKLYFHADLVYTKDAEYVKVLERDGFGKGVKSRSKTTQEQETLQLSREETIYLLKNGKAELLTTDNKNIQMEEIWSKFVNNDPDFIYKYRVFEYLRDEGLIVKSGLKYGANFGDDIDFVQLLCCQRVVSQTLLLALPRIKGDCSVKTLQDLNTNINVELVEAKRWLPQRTRQ
ncbi:hypothetical protein ROZALSC1DRAFT_22212 [Rozella allomycis CSF55]|uniref:tRNA-intron lyase n=1 Tax=Rozella allomycis (strain CSF55) TaxID=988480 RepID=A0A4P9YK82_ROZAC|nr:hypothetical protein ROZALSC1DRAFT_22212 [Rozella allomycis CSF55]